MDRLKVTYISLSVILVVLDDPRFSFAHYGIHTIDAVLVLDGTPSYLRLTNSTSLENVYHCILNTSNKINSVVLSSYLKGLEIDVGSIEQTVNNVVRNLLMNPGKIGRISWTPEDLKNFKTRLARYLAINYFNNGEGSDPESYFNSEMQRRPHRRYRGRDFLSKSNFEHNYYPKMLELPITLVNASEGKRTNSGNEVTSNFPNTFLKPESDRENVNIPQRYAPLGITLHYSLTPTPVPNDNATLVTNSDGLYLNLTGINSNLTTKRIPISVLNSEETATVFSNSKKISITKETNSVQEKKLHYHESSIKIRNESFSSKTPSDNVSLKAKFEEITGKVEKQVSNTENFNGNDIANGIGGKTVKTLFVQHYPTPEGFQSKKTADLTATVNKELASRKGGVQNGSEFSNGEFQTESDESWMEPDEDDFKSSPIKNSDVRRSKKNRNGMKGKKKTVKNYKRWQKGKISYR